MLLLLGRDVIPGTPRRDVIGRVVPELAQAAAEWLLIIHAVRVGREEALLLDPRREELFGPGPLTGGAEIEIVDHGKPARWVRIASPGSFRVGREPTSDIHLTDRAVSWNHAQLEVRADAILFTDVGSTHGSSRGEERLISPANLSGGDVVRCGQSTLRFFRLG